MERFPITIVGYIVAEDEDEARDVLVDVSGAGVNIERATVNGDDWWRDDRASTCGEVE